MREASYQAIDRSRRAMASADALWRDGLIPEASEFVRTAFRSLLEAWDQAPVADTDAAIRALREIGYPRVERLRAAVRSLLSVQDAAGSAEGDSADFEVVWAEAERLRRFTERRFPSPATVARARARAIAAISVLVVVVLLVGRMWIRPTFTASGEFNAEYAASYAIDGDEGSEWVLPDRSPGWIEIAFRKSRRLHGVRIVNGHNSPYLDRATERVRVTAFSDDGPAGSVEGRFQNLTEARSVLDLPLDARRVTHLRVDVLSYFKNGGAIAEIDPY